MSNILIKPSLLNDTEHLFKIVEEIALIGTWKFNLDTMVVSWSDVTKKIHEVPFDYIPNVETGLNFYKKGKYRNRITKLFDNLVKSKLHFDEEFKIVTAKNNIKWVRVIGVIGKGQYTDQNVVYGTFQDITEKTNHNKKIAIREKQFRKTFENSKTGVAFIGVDGKWLKINKHLCELLGYKESELKRLSYEKLIHPKDLKNHKTKFLEFLKGKISSYSSEKRFIHKNGTYIWATITLSIIKNDKGNNIHYVLHAKDIDDIKIKELRIKNLFQVSEKQNKKLIDFAHIVSHNIRSHYSNLSMLLNDIEMDDRKLAKTEQFKLLRTTIENLGETIFNLNDTINLKVKDKDSYKLISLKSSVKKAIINVKSLADYENIHLIQKIDASLTLHTIPAYIDSIFLNLLTNSIKYQSPKRQLVIEISAQKKLNSIAIKFKDNGLGIDLSLHKDKIFGMYKTFHDTENAIGLGLYNVKNQVEALNGTITVDSQVDKGTTFLITL